ncbi:MAG TPA: methyltransferase domain-containing protein [Steroidobacteraceae bacterium]|jgi:SAM-dependent methyltransferase
MHEAAKGFAKEALAYARGRPEYPVALDQWLRDALQLDEERTVVDLGAGTGKFTRRLLATGANIIAVEPVSEMLAQLTRILPDVAARSGTAENIPVNDGAVDAVVCAQSFHWFASKTALAEIRRVLKPGGHLGLIWNVRNESVDWCAAMTAIMAPYEGDAPRYRSGAWRKVFPAEGFGPLQEERFRNGHTGHPEQVIVERILSTSFIAALPRPQQLIVAARLRDLIAMTPALNRREEITVPYQTVVFSCAKL